MGDAVGIEELTPERARLLDWFVAATRLGRDEPYPMSEAAACGANSLWAPLASTTARVSFLERQGWLTRVEGIIHDPLRGQVDGFYATDEGVKVNKEREQHGEGST